MRQEVDLNADLGELAGPAGRASDRAILKYVTSCAIACGGHAGDADSMYATLKAARDEGVRIGAHPSYPDKAGFGRRPLTLSPDTLLESLKDQLMTFKHIAETLGAKVFHVKPHGALYHQAARSEQIAECLLEAARHVYGKRIALIGLADTCLENLTLKAGLSFYCEGFIDRAYQSDGRLVARDQPGAELSLRAAQIAQALQIVQDHQVTTLDGKIIPIRIDTLCLHGDHAGAAELVREIGNAFRAQEITLRPLGGNR